MRLSSLSVKKHKDFVRIDCLFNLVLGESIQFPIQKWFAIETRIHKKKPLEWSTLTDPKWEVQVDNSKKKKREFHQVDYFFEQGILIIQNWELLFI